ncbi:unnamed protein product, partial [Prorocentrum cordatum]
GGATLWPAVFEAGGGGSAFRIPCLLWLPCPGHPLGVLLAFAEHRLSGLDDWGHIDLVMRRSTDLGRTWSAARALFSAADLGAPGEVLTVGNPTAVFAEDASGGPGRAVLLFTAQFGGDSEASIWARTSRGSRWPFVTESFDGGERGAGRATSRRARRGPRGPGTPRARARRPAPPRRARRAAPRAVRPRDGGRGRLRAAALTPHLQRRPGRHLAPGGGGAAWHQRVRCGGARQRHRAAQQPRLARGRQPAGAERVGRRRRDVHGAGGQ